MNTNTAKAWRLEHEFAVLAAAQPDHIAVEVGSRHYRLSDLAAASDRLAAQLADRGAGPGGIVAIAVSDAGGFVIAALATLKTGAAYLAIDLRQSLSRAREVLAQDAATMLLVDGSLPAELVPAGLPRLDGLAGDASLPVPPPVPSTAEDIAYICFTSGSTGRPKGVVVGHAGIQGLVHDPEFSAFRSGDRTAQTSTFGFDAITHEAWGTLLRGGCLVDVPSAVLMDPARFATFLADQHISAMWCTTSYFNALASRSPTMFAGIDTLVIGGEAADADVLARVFAAGQPPRRLLNGYGPTEATTLASWHPITADDARAGVIPIGKAIVGRTLTLRDVNAEGAGELVIGGPGVAFGYLGDPERTAERFGRDADGTLHYCTGDLCRFDAGGRLLYLGRIDDQVKVRGYRIELAAVTAALSALPGVVEAATLAVPTRSGSKALVGVLRGADALPPLPELKALLAERLPDYMVPARLISVSSMPLTASGKLDRAALTRLAAAGGDQPAQTATEARLMQVLIQVLRRDSIGRDDLIGDLASDSLAMVEVLVAIESHFGTMLAPESLSGAAAVSDVASLIDATAAAPEDKRLTLLLTLPWAAAIFSADVSTAIAADGPVQTFVLPPALLAESDPIAAAAEAVVDRLQALAPGGRYVLAGYSFSGTVAQQAAARLASTGQTVDWLVLIDAYHGRPDMMTRLRSRLRRAGRAAADGLDDAHMRRRAVKAVHAHRPARFDGPTLSIRSDDPDLRHWPGWAAFGARVAESRVPGSHLDLIQEPASIAAVAAAIRAGRRQLTPSDDVKEIEEDDHRNRDPHHP